jgi:putative nucleotidyltransferase with HDIG domain
LAMAVKNLQILEEQCPGCARFVIAQANEKDDVFRSWKGLAPTLLRAEEGASAWSAILARGVTINRWIMKPEIRHILPRIRSVPTLPASHRRLVEVLQDPQFQVHEVASLIIHDVTLTAQLLKIVNSVIFGLSHPIHSVPEAVAMVGATRLQALVMSAWAFFFINEGTCPSFSPAAEWSHALEVAKIAQQLAKEKNMAETEVDEAFTAGLLHDIGKIALAANEPIAYSMILKDAKRSNRPLWQVEKENLGATHAELGGCLLATWGMALPIVEAIAWHHEPELASDKGLSPLTVVRMANEQVSEAEKASSDGDVAIPTATR